MWQNDLFENAIETKYFTSNEEWSNDYLRLSLYLVNPLFSLFLFLHTRKKALSSLMDNDKWHVTLTGSRAVWQIAWPIRNIKLDAISSVIFEIHFCADNHEGYPIVIGHVMCSAKTREERTWGSLREITSLRWSV